MKKHGVPDEDFYRGPIGDGMESERLHARIAELERALVIAETGVYEGIWTHGDLCEHRERCAATRAMKTALAEIKSVLGKGE